MEASCLNGEDINRMACFFIYQFERKHKKDPTVSERSMRLLISTCEEMKKRLGARLSFPHTIQLVIDDFFDNIDFNILLSRSGYENLNKDLLRREPNATE